MNNECAYSSKYCKLCSMLGVSLGIQCILVRKYEWAIKASVSWNKEYEQTGMHYSCRTVIIIYNLPLLSLKMQMAFSYVIMQCLPELNMENFSSTPRIDTAGAHCQKFRVVR